MKILSTVLQYIVVVAVIWFAVMGVSFDYHLPHFPVMSGVMVLITALSMAFTWVEIMRWGSVKPWNCLKCMTGWISLALAVVFHTPFCFAYLFIGLFVGAMFEGIKMRYL